MLKSYLKGIFDTSCRGDAREESYYSSLEGLLKEYAEGTKRKRAHVTVLPKKTEAGNPDFRIWDGRSRITGYIEAKDPSKENLDHIEDTEQLKRYLHTFPNLILTNFYEFRLYRNGELVKKVSIGRPFIAHRLKTVPPVEQEKEFLELLDLFFSYSLPRSFSARTLAVELAKRTRFLKEEVTLGELKREEKGEEGFLLGFYDAFRKYLIHNLSKEDFANLYSQTITYGLFAARTRCEKEFTRKLAFDLIPHTIGILREVFRFISLEELPQQMEWIVDDITEVLSNTDANKILHDYYKKGKGKDPIVHFYETFLAEYDPKTRERRGVYYTPEPVVSYIVRSLDMILKEKFGKEDGFATTSVTVLDPAGGTVTFMAETAKHAVETFISKYGEGAKSRFIKEHILKNFYSFELMMAPYAVGHLKMGYLLDELGYRLGKDDRFKLYLTNTLEMEEFEETRFPFMKALSEESHLAGEVKRDVPILAIMGNPPYSGISANVSEKYISITTKKGEVRRKKVKTWIGDLIEDYKYVDGKHFGEKKHWLQDDYVKFIRFAQWKIDEAGLGVLGFITNHSWLDNPTFRGMRQSLMESFDEIYVLDLHGNSLKKEKCPDGSKDKNVFDIRQGVAISLFVKTGKKKAAKVSHAGLWGLREDKYGWLEKNDINKTKWKPLTPSSPYYFLVPREEAHREHYEKFIKVTDMFPVNVTGIVTARDKLVVDLDKSALKSRIIMFRNKDLSDKFIKDGLNLKENYMWRVSKARNELMEVKDWEEYFTKILYRPFDVREIYYHPSVVWRTRQKVMRHMMRENLGLIVPRQFKEIPGAFVTQNIAGHKTVSAFDINYLFPLYLYGDEGKERRGALKELFAEKAGSGSKRPNISSDFLKILAEAYGKSPSPEEVFYYVYAVLYSNVYRKKYEEFLKVDFPRIPFTKDRKLFKKMGEYGKDLAELHLMKSKRLDKKTTKFEGAGDYRVKKPVYNEKRVYINDKQYFEGVGPELWEYHVGGYRVMEKWLKDRKDKTLSIEDIKHYCKIATALSETISLQKDIDAIYPKVEKVIFP